RACASSRTRSRASTTTRRRPPRSRRRLPRRPTRPSRPRQRTTRRTMRLLPRRLRHGEEATLVEHLGELRARLVVCLIALAVGFGVAFGFHVTIIHWLNGPLPENLKPTTLGVAEPFLTSMVVSLWVGVALAFPIIVWQLWGFLAPAFQEHTQRVLV